MSVSREVLQQSYKKMPDDELLDLVASDSLTELARSVADSEMKQRGLSLPEPEPMDEQEHDELAEEPLDISDFETAASFSDSAEAYLVSHQLEQAGLLAIVVEDQALANSGGSARIQVPKDQVDQAKEILDTVNQSTAEQDEETDDDHPCPKCASKRTMFASRGLFKSLFSLFSSQETQIQCTECGHVWSLD